MEKEKILVTKEIAIDGFKKCCLSTDPQLQRKRIIAVGTQFQRSVWDIDNDSIGRIRIADARENPVIIAFVLIDSEYKANTDNGGAYEFDISKDEYDELKKLYFADIKENDYKMELGIF